GDRLRSIGEHDWRLLVGGELTAGSTGRRVEVVDPSTEQVLAEVPDVGPEDVAAAVQAAEDAFASWRRVAPRERATIVRGLVAALEEHREEFAFLDAADAGNPISGMRGDITWAVDAINVLADSVMELGGSTIPASAEHLHFTRREP
nr:aldehyde dehydrogenase family protein [Euzebyales bacterium]